MYTVCRASNRTLPCPYPLPTDLERWIPAIDPIAERNVPRGRGESAESRFRVDSRYEPLLFRRSRATPEVGTACSGKARPGKRSGRDTPRLSGVMSARRCAACRWSGSLVRVATLHTCGEETHRSPAWRPVKNRTITISPISFQGDDVTGLSLSLQ